MSTKLYKNFRITFLLFGCLFFSQYAHSQLQDFTLSVVKTDESCTGNASLTFNVSGTATGASIIYSVYLLPDTVTPLVVLANNTFTGITSGTYLVVATQSLGNLTNSQQQTVTILDTRSALLIDVDGKALNCHEGSITVNVLQGHPATYEITAGPLTFPPQPSNTFNHLPSGQYTIKTVDTCGDAVVQVFTLLSVPNELHLQASIGSTQSCALLDCNTRPFNFRIYADDHFALAYPIQVEITVLPPGGGTPIVITQTLNSGDSVSQTIAMNLPYYGENQYYVNIKVSDSCGNIFIKNGAGPVTGAHHFQLGIQPPDVCYKQININDCLSMPPYTIDFVSAPAGFHPTDFFPSNVFSTLPISYTTSPGHDLPDGNYVIKMTDGCGNVFQDHIQVHYSTTTAFVLLPATFVGCDFVTWVHIPELGQGILVQTISIIDAPPGYNHQIPYDIGSYINPVTGVCEISFTVPGVYTFQGVNICGFPYTTTVTIDPPNIVASAVGSNVNGCQNNTGQILAEVRNGPGLASVTITEAPPEFAFSLPYDASSFILMMIDDPTKPSGQAVITGLPVGEYTLYMTDVCGHVYGPFHVSVPLLLSQALPVVFSLPGCETGNSSISVVAAPGTNTYLVQVIILEAPPTFAYTLPFDAAQFVSPHSGLYMNHVPEGTYKFYTKDSCGIEHTFTSEVLGYHIQQNDVEFQGNCGSFDLQVHFEDGVPAAYGTLWLQRYNPVLDRWEHPMSGFPYQPGSFPNTVNSFALAPSNYNIIATGLFRIIRTNFIYNNGSPDAEGLGFSWCLNVIKEFEFTGSLAITRAYTFACVNGNSQVIIIAGDNVPLHYRITSKDGQPFFVDNGNSNIFSNLAPGIYNFEVSDVCGNIVNRIFNLVDLEEPVISSDFLCDRQDGKLSVQPFSFLNYQWWKDDDNGNILSTTNELYFTPFLNAVTPGTYHVRIYSTSPLSCVDRVISYVVNAVPDANAGADGEKTICNNNAPIDLFSVLGAPYDAGGIWTETSASGGLSGHTWSPSGVGFGTYTFNYQTRNSCDFTDDALVTIHYNAPPPEPVITANSFCKNQTMQLHADAVAGATFHWTGPNGFTSNLQDPQIANASALNNGLYVVSITVNGCDSATSMQLTLQPQPDFQLVPACVNGKFTITVNPIQSSFNANNATYSWTGPQGFTSTENPVQIDNLPTGLYQVTVTNSEGCTETHSIPVSSTLCGIPSVITPNDDQINDSFDLTGLDVERIEIYSRWGRLVYEQNNYINQWHGQNMHNGELPDSTYYYILYLKSGDEKIGWVYKTAWR